MLTIIHIAEIAISNLGNQSEWQLTEDTSAEGVVQLYMADTIIVRVAQKEKDSLKKIIRRNRNG